MNPYLTCTCTEASVTTTSPAAAGPRLAPALDAPLDLLAHVATRGACTDLADPDVMFPDPYDPVAVRNAAQVCAACPVRAACARLAELGGEEHGMWGGELREPAPEWKEAG